MPFPRIAQYLQRLPLDERERERLLGAVPAGADREAQFAALQRALGDNPEYEQGAASSASIRARLRMLPAAEVPRRGDAHFDRAFTSDLKAHPRLATMPPIRRASMAPRAWNQNPVSRLSHWLGRKLFGLRGQMAPSGRQDAEVDAPTPQRSWRLAGLVRRLVLTVLALGQTAVATYYMTAVLPYHGRHDLEIAILVVYAILFAWISAGFWTAMMGFWVLLWGGDRYAISRTAPEDAPIAPDARTAIVVPICNEDVARVFAGVRATYDSLARVGVRESFDLFILSDTSKPDLRVAEVDAWLRLCREVDGWGHVFYRRRAHRIKRKSGNIADWCRRWGSIYRYMVILDADSVMTGACLKRLVQLMEANPGTGIIQTAPRASGRETLYARIQQFATRVYGPLFTAGLHYWQLGESHYWGHNAILRVAPFMRHCALGKLPGRGALAGEILSHDFVEAALMRRAGWSVWIAYDLAGSYEEMPPALLDELRRDQRWCQGNLQNFRLFLTSGLHPAHRAVFMTGVMAYLSAPLWFLFLVLNTALLAVFMLSEPTYFTQPYQLFPTWPEWHPEWAITLFSGTMLLLFLPKVLAALLLVFKPALLRQHGGIARLSVSLLVEIAFSSLLAPVRMLFHTRYVLTALAGFAVQWKSPPRGDAATPWLEAVRRHAVGTVIGLGWIGLVYWLNPDFLWWLLPVAGALVVSIPLSVWSSRITLGRTFRRWRLLLIPEESFPPRELRWLRAAIRRAAEHTPGFVDAVVNPVLNALIGAAGYARERLPPKVREARHRAVDRAVTAGPSRLSDPDRNVIIADPIALSRLHGKVWANPESHRAWGVTPQ